MTSSYRLDSESEIRLRTRYTPVVPPDVLSRELGIPEAEICKLDANENLYGAHPQVPRDGVVEGSKVRRRAKSVSDAIRAPKSVPSTP